MALTNFSALTDEAKTVWSKDMWKAARNASFIEKFVGTGPNAPIQRITELRKDEKGARAVITLIADLVGDGVAGDSELEGNEEAVKSYDKVIQLDQLRHANRHKGRMEDQRSVVNFRMESRDVLAYWLGDRIDQLAFLTLAGLPYNQLNSGVNFASTATTTRPAAAGTALADLDFNADVVAGSSQRSLRWDFNTSQAQSTLVTNASSASTGNMAATDTPSYAMIVALKAWAKQHYVRGVKGPGNEEFYHLFVSPAALAKLKMDADYIANLRNAGMRGASNELFAGASSSILVDGVFIHEHRHVPQGTLNSISSCRGILIGAQALAYADIGTPEWVEKGFDYENSQGISTGKIFGMLKPTFYSIYDGSVQDFGVITVDMAQA